MKTVVFYHKSGLTLILVANFWLMWVGLANSQGIPLAKTNPINSNSEIIQFETGNYKTLGIGNAFQGSNSQLQPTAKLHLLEPILGVYPIFKLEVEDAGTIKYLLRQDNTNYGIYQTHQVGTTLLNYFQDPLKIGYATISDDGTQSSFSTDWNITSIDFKMAGTAGAFNHPFTIYPNGVKAKNIQVTDGFQLMPNPGNGKILASDDQGNGTWTDASSFNDNDWLVETVTLGGHSTYPQNLYVNPHYENVGIGTPTPRSKLHIVDGNILISRSHAKAPGSINGSILFGEIISSEYPLGEWGIEYYSLFEDDASRGLNFWKVASGNNTGDNFCLYLKNDGNVGIGTSAPHDKFQVNAGFEKLSAGSANIDGLGSGTSYIGFNTARKRTLENNAWILESDGTHNGGNITYGDIEGNYHIVTIPSNESGGHYQYVTDSEVANHIRLTVTKDGNVGIGTKNTHGYQLAVNGKIICTNIKVQLEDEWPDYVFNADYQLRPIPEVESFINEHNHLPGIPSANELKKNGVDVGEMNAGLLTKIEELTLYIIDQQKQLEKQQQQIDELIHTLKTK